MAKKPTASKPDKVNASKLDEMARALNAAGYEVKRRVPYIKHSFQIERPTYEAFMHLVGQHGIKVKDAVTEALQQWVESNS